MNNSSRMPLINMWLEIAIGKMLLLYVNQQKCRDITTVSKGVSYASNGSSILSLGTNWVNRLVV